MTDLGLTPKKIAKLVLLRIFIVKKTVFQFEICGIRKFSIVLPSTDIYLLLSGKTFMSK